MQRALHDVATEVHKGKDSNLELANQSDVDVFLCVASGKKKSEKNSPIIISLPLPKDDLS